MSSVNIDPPKRLFACRRSILIPDLRNLTPIPESNAQASLMQFPLYEYGFATPAGNGGESWRINLRTQKRPSGKDGLVNKFC